MALEKEVAAFNRERPNWAEYHGRWAVIFGDKVIGIFNDYEDGLRAGYAVAKLQPFLVKKIEAVDSVERLTRRVSFPCPT